MKVCEIFTSIQGESTIQGTPTVFVRLAGCNLDCQWCDSRYARTGGTDRDISEVMTEICGSGVHAVCFTGGEPTGVSPCCRIFDIEPDGDVDLGDYASFRLALTGPQARAW